MPSLEAPAVPYGELASLLFLAAVDARNRKRSLQLIEADIGLYKIVSGTRPWRSDVRAYITAAGVVTESTHARREGFTLPILDPRVTVVRSI